MDNDFESIMKFNGYEDRDIDGDLIPEHWGHQGHPPRNGAEGHRLDTPIRMPLGTAAPAQGRTASIKGVPAVPLSSPKSGGPGEPWWSIAPTELPWDFVTYEPTPLSYKPFLVLILVCLPILLVLGLVT